MNKRRKVKREPYSTYISGIADRRIELGMTQIQLAKRLKIARTSLANIEAGKQSIKIVDTRKWMRTLKLNAEQFLCALGI